MQLLQWFKDRVNNKVTVTHATEGKGFLHITDARHAEYLHKTQTASNYSYADHDESDNSLMPIVTGILVGEALSDMSNDFAQESGMSSSFDGFGGGLSDGGGASGSWDSGSDSSSFDSGSSSSDF